MPSHVAAEELCGCALCPPAPVKEGSSPAGPLPLSAASSRHVKAGITGLVFALALGSSYFFITVTKDLTEAI